MHESKSSKLDETSEKNAKEEAIKIKNMETSKNSFRGTYWTEWPFVTHAKKKYMKKCRKTIKNKKTVTTIFSRDVLDGMAICELCIHKFNNEMFTNQHACAQERSRPIPITKIRFIIFEGCIGRFGRRHLKVTKKTFRNKKKMKNKCLTIFVFRGTYWTE